MHNVEGGIIMGGEDGTGLSKARRSSERKNFHQTTFLFG